MKKMTKDTGWTVDQGLAAQYAAQAGLDPELAAAAGNKAWDVLKSMRDAADEADPARRAKLVRRTRRRLKDSGLGGHRDLIKQIRTRLDALSSDAPYPSVNPETGLQEFRFECVEGRGGPCETVADPIDTLVHNFVYRADGTPARSQPGITNYSPGQFAGSFGTSGGGLGLGNKGLGRTSPQMPKDPPGLATNNGLPEEVVVTGDRYKAIMDNLEDATNDSLEWANQRAWVNLVRNTSVPMSLAALPSFAKKTFDSKGVNVAVGGITALALGYPTWRDINAIENEIDRRKSLHIGN